MSRLADVPLIEEIPAMPDTVRIPLGAPPAYRRVVIDRAGGQCECTGDCGIAHQRSANRYPRRHGGWHARKETVLALAPRRDGLLLPLHVQAALSDDKLQAWCEDCQRKAQNLAKEAAK